MVSQRIKRLRDSEKINREIREREGFTPRVRLDHADRSKATKSYTNKKPIRLAPISFGKGDAE